MTTILDRRRRPRFTVVACVLATLSAIFTLVGVGSGSADARPTEAPRLGIYGEDIWATGPGCSGPIHVGVQTDPAHRGQVFATYRPGRFSGTCTLRVWSNWGIQLPGHNWSPPLAVGPRGGAPVKKTLRTGSGLQGMGFGVAGPHKSVSYYLIVP